MAETAKQPVPHRHAERKRKAPALTIGTKQEQTRGESQRISESEFVPHWILWFAEAESRKEINGKREARREGAAVRSPRLPLR